MRACRAARVGACDAEFVLTRVAPDAVGIGFTSWELEETALVSAAITLIATALVYYSIRRQGILSAPVLARSGLFWVAFVAYVVVAVV